MLGAAWRSSVIKNFEKLEDFQFLVQHERNLEVTTLS